MQLQLQLGQWRGAGDGLSGLGAIATAPHHLFTPTIDVLRSQWVQHEKASVSRYAGFAGLGRVGLGATDIVRTIDSIPPDELSAARAQTLVGANPHLLHDDRVRTAIARLKLRYDFVRRNYPGANVVPAGSKLPHDYVPRPPIVIDYGDGSFAYAAGYGPVAQHGYEQVPSDRVPQSPRMTAYRGLARYVGFSGLGDTPVAPELGPGFPTEAQIEAARVRDENGRLIGYNYNPWAGWLEGGSALARLIGLMLNAGLSQRERANRWLEDPKRVISPEGLLTQQEIADYAPFFGWSVPAGYTPQTGFPYEAGAGQPQTGQVIQFPGGLPGGGTDLTVGPITTTGVHPAAGTPVRTTSVPMSQTSQGLPTMALVGAGLVLLALLMRR